MSQSFVEQELIIKPSIKEVEGFPGYSVSSDGVVYRNGRSLKPNIRSKRYHAVCLSRENKRYDRFIHVLVLEAFVCKRPEGMQTCHNDGNPINNRLDNLRWDTKSNNEIDKLKHGTEPHTHLSEQDVLDIRWMLSLRTLKQKDIALMYGVKRETISGIKNRRTWKHL